ncbi:hypothetical protein RMT89_04115 [Streptomyces sp. P17]|nr:hypothetical protein [Streptomyces sp. P17]MDT9695174.1 hypothetical protein [Streptomyces sp. P17]
MTFTLVDADGHQVTVPTPMGPQPIQSVGEIEVGRPAGLAHGTPIDAAFALNVGSLPLQEGRYQWRLDLADEQANAFFTVQNVNA